MDNFRDFCTWAGGRRQASELLGISKARTHRLYHGGKLEPAEALLIEQITRGLFRKERLIFGGLGEMWGGKDNGNNHS